MISEDPGTILPLSLRAELVRAETYRATYDCPHNKLLIIILNLTKIFAPSINGPQTTVVRMCSNKNYVRE